MAHSHHICTIFSLDNFLHKAIMPQLPDPRHNLRLPPELKKKIAHSAVDNGRSMNAEILDRLEKSFSPSPLENMEFLLKGIASLSDKDRAEVSAMLAKVASILGK